MSDEERSASEHRSVLAGMTSAEAKEWVALCEVVTGGLTYSVITPAMDRKQCRTLLALAALGAEVVGAKEGREGRWKCPECGVGVAVDEDGCCSGCGRDCEERACRVLVLEGE